jgi:hypothetical protein
MTSRQTNMFLTGAAMFVGIAALAVLAAGVLVPIESLSGEKVAQTNPMLDTDIKPATQPAGLDSLFTRSFRNSLDDAPSAEAAKAAMAAAPVATTSPLQVNLIGTIGSSVAILRLADGSMVARGVGDQIDGAEIVRIEPAAVDFRRNGQRFSIAKPMADASAGLIVIR